MRDTVTREIRDDRGAVLPLLAVFLLIFMIIAALAVDLSALARRGQTLQNTADAAALAGVAVWTETGDSTLATAVVNDIITQNGVGVTDSVTWVVSFPSPNEVVVDLTDPDPDVFIGGFIPGSGGDVSRDASARLDSCEIGCDIAIEIPRPFQPVTAFGSGDGYTPIAIGDRLYGINHDDDEIACVDRETESACWSYVDATLSSDSESGSVSKSVAIGTQIWWTAQEPTQLGLFCWETIFEVPCGAPITISGLDRADSLGNHYLQRGGGLIGVDDKIYVFTDDHRVHCYDPIAGSTCPGYSGGLMGGLSAVHPPLDPAKKVSGSNIDSIEHNGKIYYSLHVRDGSVSELHYDTGVWLGCWDTATRLPCSLFTPYKLHNKAQRQEGRLFFHRTSAGVPNGVCSTGLGDIQCTDMNGVADEGIEDGMGTLEAALPNASDYTSGMGVHMWHEPTNRVFLTTVRSKSTNYCWDFNTGVYCNSIYGFANGEETQDYGFIYEGNCIFALGHNSIFWSFTTNLVAGCPGSTVTEQVDKCECNGVERWGNVSFNFDIGPSSVFTVLKLQVRDPDGNIVLPEAPFDPLDPWESIVGHPTGVIDLNSIIPPTHDYLTLSIYAETDGTDLWSAGDPPIVTFGFNHSPFLVE